MSTAVANLEIPRDLLESTRLSLSDLKTEIAVHLYAQRRLPIGKAHEFAGLSLWQFRQILGARRIAPDYDVEDLEQDVATLRELQRL